MYLIIILIIYGKRNFCAVCDTQSNDLRYIWTMINVPGVAGALTFQAGTAKTLSLSESNESQY